MDDLLIDQNSVTFNGEPIIPVHGGIVFKYQKSLLSRLTNINGNDFERQQVEPSHLNDSFIFHLSSGVYELQYWNTNGFNFILFSINNDESTITKIHRGEAARIISTNAST